MLLASIVRSVFSSQVTVSTSLWPLNLSLLPNLYSRESNWEQWLLHCASVNSWDDDKKLSFLLKVHLTGRVQAVFRRLPDVDKNSFDTVVKALEAHFEPKGKRELYLAEFTTCTKKLSESWLTHGEEIQWLAAKVYRI